MRQTIATILALMLLPIIAQAQNQYEQVNDIPYTQSTDPYAQEPKRDAWVHALYRQQGHKGELFLDGKLVGRNDNMPILADIFRDAPANCWIGRAPFRGDEYLVQTDVADFRIFNYAVSNQELRQLKQKAGK